MTSTLPPSDLPTIGHWIGGGPLVGRSGRTAPVHDPARGEQTAHVALGGPDEIDAAVAAAATAFPGWRDLSLARRQAVLFRFRQLLDERKQELALLITAEHGKVLDDALGEIARGLEVVDFATGFPHLLKGSYTKNASTGVDVHSTHEPLGVVGVISPFNFPAMVPLWFLPVAIAAGNTVVLKPSEKDPSAANWLAALFTEAGLPDGVLNVLHGDKEAVEGLLRHPEVRAVSFVGSTPVARYVYETASGNGKRVQALGGAKNHMLVLPDADLDQAADAAINAGFGSAGERCMAISVVVAVDSIADELVDRIRTRMAKLTVGDGRRGCDMGPLISRQHRDKVASYVGLAADDGAHMVVDGRDTPVNGDAGGFWLGPTLLDRVPTSSNAYQDEIFGPVLSVVRVPGFEEGVALINSGAYGNGTAIFTRNGGAARRFQHQVQVGMIGVNVPIPVPVGYYSFGGFRSSLFGDTKAYGTQGFHFFTQEKTVTSRWADPGHGGIDLGFPRS
jgi:malonate-semialdehyde dehydrogenase (acetylating)/methylmalonate-semialdehyde dehydrogenase